jgi:hypothetical protein
MRYEIGFTLGLPEALDPRVVEAVATRKAEELILHVAREEMRLPYHVKQNFRMQIAGPFSLREDEEGQPLPPDPTQDTVFGWHLRLDPKGV